MPNNPFPYQNGIPFKFCGWSVSIISDGNDNPEYVGHCNPEFDSVNDTDKAVWAIAKIIYNSEVATNILWARDGGFGISKQEIFDNYLSLTYR